MLNLAYSRKMGDLFKTVVGLVPLANAAGTRNGTAIDRAIPGGIQFQGMTLIATTGVITGTPDSQTIDAKIQDSADGTTGWADYVPPSSGANKITQITAANTLGEIDIDLSGAKRYIRVVEVIAFVNGTTPKIEAGETVLLYGADRIPA